MTELNTVLSTEQQIEDKYYPLGKSIRLGISQIGESCDRKIFYKFYWCSSPKISARIKRLFGRGTNEEPIVIKDLESIGVIVHSMQDVVFAGYGHIKGKIDGIAENVPDAPKTPHLLEIKTMNNKNFGKFTEKNGVEKKFPEYYAQIQVYMYLKKLKRALFIGVNKNTDERYYERIPVNNNFAKELLNKAQDIIFSDFLPHKFESFKCRWCEYKEICMEGKPVEKNCRTCKFAAIHDEGQWQCAYPDNMIGKYLTYLEQKWEVITTNCSHYKVLGVLK